jgi:hypothetical protein
MLQFGHNMLISMDAMFSINDMKYHLFTLMVFDFHHIRVPIWYNMEPKLFQGYLERDIARSLSILLYEPKYKMH